MDIDELKRQSARAWDNGNYPVIADLILPVSRALVDACFISAGQEVLDVAAGNGNLAVLAGEEGADVVALDFSENQIELGRTRTEAEGLDVEWILGDAEELPFEDDRFDCAASVFGAMFAPRPERVAAEMFRVVKPGGTVGMSNWGHYGFQAEMFELQTGFGPPQAEGIPHPRDWGMEEVVEERLGPYASSLQTERKTVRYEFESFEVALATFGSAGPSATARQQMEPETLQQLVGQARELVERWNQADDGRLVIDAEYLQVVARKRG
jgi:SAM-dependent methyltransferase